MTMACTWPAGTNHRRGRTHRPSAARSVRAPSWMDLLSEREKEVLRCVAQGRSNAEIASELFISLATVKTHVTRLLLKPEVRDRVQLVVAAYRSGFVV